jgi:hypothetical protein
MSETVATPVVETPVAAPEATTIAEHESTLGTTQAGEDDAPLDDVVDDDRQSRGRGSRAKSKMAAARINKLTGEILTLRQRLEAHEAAQKSPTPKAEPVFALPEPPRVPQGDPEPTIEQFADRDDPYGAWQRALAKWDRHQEALQASVGQQQQQFQQTAQQAEQYWAGVSQTHVQRLAALVARDPNAASVLQSVKLQIPPLLDRSIMLDENSADVALYLASHPSELDDFVLRTAAQPVTEQTVAITRRLLRQRMTAETTGSVAPSQPLPTPPSPPNPVRTGAIRSADAPPGDDSMSIAAHERFFGKKRR